MLSPALLILALTALTTALPSRLLRRDPTAQLISIAPTSGSCANPPAAGECATASQAADPMIASFSQYGVSTAAEQAALIAWMAYESVDFKYNINHVPGTPGQGTKCMMSPTNVAKYVASIPAVSAQAASSTDPSSVLDLVLGDQYTFASAAWYYSTQCSADVKTQLQTGTEAGWEGFLTGCVDLTSSDLAAEGAARDAYWNRAVAALGVTST